jgi:hypothetical protein
MPFQGGENPQIHEIEKQHYMCVLLNPVNPVILAKKTRPPTHNPQTPQS